ncbi:PadR family transcriptional regulator [Leifsonia poae]|uniref:PadR family transcriptional regulator n=1 Tax=Leifsonia poae TaxID=110933 RepID=A0A9W6HAK0_9MICO|nr:PadR family transcriptional regulator [Leifsonia poae]GLJ76479.1 PadR family transcriptional regulator [Leifsonia poae]
MATTTRMLVLGVARIFAPANGYQLRRELVSWHVDDWAKVNPGSIYSMLSTLSRQGMLEAHALPDGARTVTVYTVTDAGLAELDRLLRDAIRAVTPMDPTGFRVAFSFAPLFERTVLATLLEERLLAVRARAAVLRGEVSRLDAEHFAPPHVGYSVQWETRMLDAEDAWLIDLIAHIRSGGLDFMDEPMTWTPAPDDEGWEMARETARYREQLDRMREAEAARPRG